MTPAITDLSNHSPADLGYMMPAESDRHVACWMAWPSEHVQWDDLAAVEEDYARVCNAIARFEPVVMVADPANISRAHQLCGDNVSVLEMPLDDSWMRDTGPSFIKHQGSGAIAGVDWRFNCWGGFTPTYQQDAQIANRVLNHLGMPAYHSCLVFEGGAFHVDGDGTLMTTESVLLNANRNPGIDKSAAEIELCRATGARRVIWLPGDPDGITGDMTDGHIDGITCFIKPGVVLFESDPHEEGDYAALQRENRRALELARDALGRSLEIVDLEVSHEEIETRGESFCSSYINFYLPNGGLVMPCYGVDADQTVSDQLSALFPDRSIVMVDIRAIAPGGGGIHCITQQQPA